MSDPAILKRLAERLKQIRIRQTLTQAELAKKAGVSLLTVANFENGKSVTMANFIRMIRVLGLLENLDLLLPEPKISPILLREWQARYGKQPKRVRKSSKTALKDE